MSKLLLCSILLLAQPGPDVLSAPAAEVGFDIADVACWRRLLAGMACGTRAPTEMVGTLFPGVRSDLAAIAHVPPSPDAIFRAGRHRFE